MLNFSKGSKTDAVTDEHYEKNMSTIANEDGGLVDRPRLEKRLVRKLDLRFSILIVIYILNCKPELSWSGEGGGETRELTPLSLSSQTSTATMSRPPGRRVSRRTWISPALNTPPCVDYQRRQLSFGPSSELTFAVLPSQVLSILYVGYLLMQIPSNMVSSSSSCTILATYHSPEQIVQYTGRPSFYLPTCICLWGMISMTMAVVHNYIGALMIRFFLGYVPSAPFLGALMLGGG
jgi:hypothetical protein